MLHYSRGDVYATIYWWGGINRVICVRSVLYLGFVSVVYFIEGYTETYVNCSREAINSLAGFVVFLLVFRLNQCMQRYNEAHDVSAQVFSGLEQILCTALCCLRGQETDALRLAWPDGPSQVDVDKMQQRSELAAISKVNFIRLTLALAVSYLLHSKLQDAVTDQLGYMHDFQMQQVMFLYFRLQCLLYDEEMKLVDQALHVYKENPINPQLSSFSQGRRFRAEVSRHVVTNNLKPPIIGTVPAEGGGTYEGKSVAPLPTIVAQMLYRSLLHPLDQPWGYPQRTMNIFSAQLQEVLGLLARLDTTIKVPLPLLYLQHCRCLLLIFALCYPMSIDPTDGIMDNIIMPLLLLWSMLGFESIAEQLENPLGDDDADINLWEHLHTLEVYCRHAFDSSEASETVPTVALQKIAVDFKMGVAGTLTSHMTAADQAAPSDSWNENTFDAYFTWLPLPTHHHAYLVETHGQVRFLHQIRRKAGQDFLSQTLQKWRQRSPFDTGRRFLEDVSNIELEATNSEVEKKVESDPMTCTHYLVFRGCYGRLMRMPSHKDLHCAEAIDDADSTLNLGRSTRLSCHGSPRDLRRAHVCAL